MSHIYWLELLNPPLLFRRDKNYIWCDLNGPTPLYIWCTNNTFLCKMLWSSRKHSVPSDGNGSCGSGNMSKHTLQVSTQGNANRNVRSLRIQSCPVSPVNSQCLLAGYSLGFSWSWFLQISAKGSTPSASDQLEETRHLICWWKVHIPHSGAVFALRSLDSSTNLREDSFFLEEAAFKARLDWNNIWRKIFKAFPPRLPASDEIHLKNLKNYHPAVTFPDASRPSGLSSRLNAEPPVVSPSYKCKVVFRVFSKIGNRTLGFLPQVVA